jgi:hypothetical protein
MLGRVHAPREKREQMLDEYERSGMNGAESGSYHGQKTPGKSLPPLASSRIIRLSPFFLVRPAADLQLWRFF